MEKINFSTHINASPEKVWKTLWDDASYRAWTRVFAEGSSVKTDNWKEGTKVLFVDGTDSGMVSRVASNKPNEYMSFEHLGEIKNGIEDTTSEKVKQWAGCRENYTLKETNGATDLFVDMDISPEYKDYFEKTWPNAMNKIKELAENN